MSSNPSTRWETRSLSKKLKKHTNERLFTREGIGHLRVEHRTPKGRFFVTAAVAGAKVNEKALLSIKNYCKRTGSKPIILAMRSHVQSFDKQPEFYDEILLPYLESKNLVTEYVFNKNLRAIDAQLNPQISDPLSGQNEQGIRQDGTTSIIIAHSKQHLQSIATSCEKLPRLLLSTGCITYPKYRKNAVGMKARNSHKMGGWVVEIDKDEFHIRPVQFDNNGNFVSLGVKYKPDGTTQEIRAEGFAWGDSHFGEDDPQAKKAGFEQMKKVKPKKIFVHDISSFGSVTHHMEGKTVSKYKRHSVFQTLASEIQAGREGILELVTKSPNDSDIYVVRSNHDNHLEHYIDEGRYAKDHVNIRTVAPLLVPFLDGHNPTQIALDPEKNLIWLEDNKDIWVEGYLMSLHGHQAANGSRGNIKGFKTTVGKAIIGHSHTPGIFGDIMQVGTSSFMRLGYNSGLSSWLQANAVVYKGGFKELLISVKGKWRL